MRGKPQAKAYMSAPLRITPADAGKTLFIVCRHRHGEDHPRGCGENVLYGFLCAFLQGSPPRMRGKRPDKAQYRREDRITPADAGKTRRLTPAFFANLDHPRGCGENPVFRLLPRMLLWITPADAGKTHCSGGKGFRVWDHPRGCGENTFARSFRARLMGSPPRMRGKQLSSFKRTSFARITPADAGKTVL